ncbi:MAG: SUMF1/EgtB/PvdO family nonheme iron enzyme [Bacteroidia bacterium]
MKTSLSILFISFLLPYFLPAQCNEKMFSSAMHRADSCEKAGNYALAFKKYKSAAGDCPEKTAEAEGAIVKLFATINKLREDAETAKTALDDKLQKIKRANEGLVSPLINLFDGFVNDTDYEAAKDILEKAVAIDRQLNYAGKETFTYAYLQLIYYHTECGRENSTASHKKHIRMATQLSKAMLLYREEKNKLYTSGDTLQYLQTVLKEYVKTEDLKNLHNCYYPNMIKLEGGTFEMAENYNVSLSDYEIAQTEVTVHQYLMFCEKSGYQKPEPPSWGFRGDNPVVNVSWGDAAAYSNWLTKQENADNSPVYTLEGNTEWDYKKSGDYGIAKTIKRTNKTSKGYRLPTEAEWQFAASGGKNGISKGYEYAGSDSLNEVAWNTNNSEGHTKSVKTRKSNDLGLYDMSGNAWEWCQDWYKAYPNDAPVAAPLGDPCSDISGVFRVVRGGGWVVVTDRCRVVHRSNSDPSIRFYNCGFRPARTL